MAVAAIELESVADHAMAIRLNRPDRLNAIDFGLVGELHEVLDKVAAADACKVVILTGTKEVIWHNLDTNNVAAAIALENRNQDLGSKNEEVRDYVSRYSATRRNR